MIDFSCLQYAACTHALVALAQVAVTLEDQEAQPIPRCSVASLVSGPAFVVPLPTGSITCVPVAESWSTDQRRTPSMAARKIRATCHQSTSDDLSVLLTALVQYFLGMVMSVAIPLEAIPSMK
ncbi:hypothetical protein D3C86_1610220 [compost metagenome]